MTELHRPIGFTFVVAASDSKQPAYADYICDGVNDEEEIQAALDALPATGGCIFLLDGTFALGAQVSRAIDDAKFIGCGHATLLNLDGGTAVITAGVQDGWLFTDFATDAGGPNIATATQSAIRNVWIAGVRTDDPAGVAAFLALTDTPAAYAGEATKAAVVNAAEDALEFAAGAPAPQYPVFTDKVIFGPALKNGTWEELDCGVGSAIVYIRIELAAYKSGFVQFLPNDEANENVSVYIGTAQFGAIAHRVGYIMMVTDSDGKLKWRTTSNIIDGTNITLTFIGYWTGHTKADALVFSGAGTAAWADMLIGPKNALCILKVTGTDAGGSAKFVARLRGETLDMYAWGMQGCSTTGSLTDGDLAYILVLTDADGYIERKNVDTRTYTVTLVTHISGATFPKMGVFDGDSPEDVWRDLDTPFGKAFAYIRQYHKADAGNTNAGWRQQGETLDKYNGAYPTLTNTGNLIVNNVAYAFVPLDEYGLVEWYADEAHSTELRVEALCQ